MANFAIEKTDPYADVVASVNYLLSNLGQTQNGLAVDTNTGQIYNPADNLVIGYLYQYLNIRYADTNTGAGFSQSPTNKEYYGVRNQTTTTPDENPADYIWTEVTGGFGTTKRLYYQTNGGRQIQFFIGTAAPSEFYQEVQNGVAIDLDVVTGTTGAPGAPGEPGENAWTGAVDKPVIDVPMNANGTYTANSQIITATFSNTTANASATIYANVSTTGNVSFSNINVGSGITVAYNTAKPYSGTATFTHSSGVTAGSIVTALNYPVAIPIVGGTSIVSAGAPVSVVTSAATVAVAYSAGQYYVSRADGTWSPAQQPNGSVQTIANTSITRGTSVISSFSRLISYFPSTQTWSITTVGTDVNIGYVTFGTPSTANNSYYLPFTFNDGVGSGAGSLAVSVVAQGAKGDPGTNGTNGTNGAPGQRGFLPLAYVVTSGNPTFYSDNDFTQAFSASRTNSSPPIGTGYSPVTGDTAAFTYINPPNAPVSVYKTFNSNLFPQWQTVTGQVIDGNLLVTGSVTADELRANKVWAIAVQSTNATYGSNSSNGFWLAANTGNARFGGGLSVGDSATIGNNLQIGSGLQVGTSATIGNNLHVGQNATIGANVIIGANATVGTNLIVGNNASFGSNVVIGQSSYIGDNLVVGNNVVIGSNLQVAGLITTGTLNANTVNTQNITNNAVSQVIARVYNNYTVIAPGSSSALVNYATPGIAGLGTYSYYSGSWAEPNIGCPVTITDSVSNYVVLGAQTVVHTEVGYGQYYYPWFRVKFMRKNPNSSYTTLWLGPYVNNSIADIPPGQPPGTSRYQNIYQFISGLADQPPSNGTYIYVWAVEQGIDTNYANYTTVYGEMAQINTAICATVLKR